MSAFAVRAVMYTQIPDRGEAESLVVVIHF